MDGSYQTIAMAISSMIGDVSGMICDGASNSCAMKVSTSVASAWKAVMMALDDSAVTGNEGHCGARCGAIDREPVRAGVSLDAGNGPADN